MPTDAVLADRSWLDAPPTRRLVQALDAAGIAFRFVGGAVRDALLGRRPSEVDLATPAHPDAVIRAMAAAGLNAIPTGIAHGTVTIPINGARFEITTLRRDVETDGRHAVVAFTDDWRADAARRDFTMNALYADRDGQVTDFFDGVADAWAGIVRFIGDPAARIAEDGLRILRFFRFQAHYGHGGLDPEGLAACARSASMIDRLSGERVRDEIFKLLKAPDPSPVWRAMIDAKIAQRAVPGAERVDDLARLVAIETRLDLPPDPVRRLAALLGPLTQDEVGTLKTRLKLANRDADRLQAIDHLRQRAGQRPFGRALYGVDADDLRDAALLSHVRSGGPDATTLGELLRFIQSWKMPVFPLNGGDPMARGVSPGPAMGRLLTEVEDWWVELDFAPTRDQCLAELDRRIALTTPPTAGAT